MNKITFYNIASFFGITTFGITAFFSITSCKKETENLKPSGIDKNLLVLKDNPADSLDHLIYTIYSNTGIPIYYNDTVGSSTQGKDVYGNPILSYETLDVFYSLTGTLNGARCVPAQNRADLLLGVKMLRDKVIPLLTAATAPKSFYLVDSIWTNAYATTTIYRGYKTTAIAQMNALSTLSDSDIETLTGSIAGGEIASYLVTNYPQDLQKFYAISNRFSTYSMYGSFKGEFSTPPATANGEEFGFITVTSYGPMSYTTPTQAVDVSSYIVAIKTIPEADFNTQYANWPYVLQKYDMMKNLLTAHKL